MLSAVFLLGAVIGANTLSVVEGDAISGATYIYPLAGMSSNATTGMELSNVKSDASIGDFLTDIPIDPSGREIDWERTYAAITNSPGIYKDRVYCVPDAENDEERILFTQGGAVSLTWYYKGGDTQGVERVYQIAENAAERPNRLYWTSAPFLGPTIDLTGKFVRLFGSPDLLKQTVDVDETSKTTNIVSGINLSMSGFTQILEARARVLDVDAQVYDGPSGQFVLAYYADGNRTKFIGSVVVEVGRPETKILDAHVGDELLPTGDGWSVQGLLPYPKDGKGGTETVEGDAASPHMTRAEYTRADSGDKVFATYAIAPNDKSTRGYADNSPTKNDIFWEKPDLTGTLWPFEEALYNVTWNPSDAMVVCSDDPADPGVGIFVPTNYTVEVCAYQDPSETAVVDSQNVNLVHVRKAGRFTLKLTTTSKPGADVWYLPVVSHSRTNSAVANGGTANGWDVVYPVGRALEPLDLGFAGTASNAYAAVDASLAGYIHTSVSSGRNWNPRLYHEPVAPMASEYTVDTGTATGEDPFADLASALYSVRPSETPIEVWWRGSFAVPSRLFGTSQPVECPVAVQRYRIREPRAVEVREIALASGLGSAGRSRATSAQASASGRRPAGRACPRRTSSRCPRAGSRSPWTSIRSRMSSRRPPRRTERSSR